MMPTIWMPTMALTAPSTDPVSRPRRHAVTSPASQIRNAMASMTPEIRL